MELGLNDILHIIRNVSRLKETSVQWTSIIVLPYFSNG